MNRDLRGEMAGDGLCIAVVVSRFNEFITSKLLSGARLALKNCGVSDKNVTIARVPGSFEIPLVAKKMAESTKYDAVICLGAVIKGETDHYDHVSNETAAGIAAVARGTGVPVIFGVLTTETVGQAIDRSGGENGNTGYKAAVSAVEMANLLRALD